MHCETKKLVWLALLRYSLFTEVFTLHWGRLEPNWDYLWDVLVTMKLDDNSKTKYSWTNIISSIQLPTCVWLFGTPWTGACQASLSITNSWSLLKLMSIELVMLILCCPLLFQPSIFLSIRVFSSESVLRIKWPNYWNFSFSISPSNEYSGWFPLGLTGWISLQSKGLSRVFSNTTV